MKVLKFERGRFEKLVREAIEGLCADEGEVKEKVREVFMHELGHHFGMTEEDLVL